MSKNAQNVLNCLIWVTLEVDQDGDEEWGKITS